MQYLTITTRTVTTTMTTTTPPSEPKPAPSGTPAPSFAETALTLGGKSADEAKRMGRSQQPSPQVASVVTRVHDVLSDLKHPLH